LWFPDSPVNLRSNVDFSIWMRVQLQQFTPGQAQVLASLPERWILFIRPDGFLDLRMESWNNALVEPMRRLKTNRVFMPDHVDAWVDLGFSFRGNAADKIDDEVKVYLDGELLGTFTGAAAFDARDHLYLGGDGGGKDRADALFDRVICFDGVLDEKGFRELSGQKPAKGWSRPSPIGEIRRFDVSKGIWGIAISPDGSRALTANDDSTIGLWDVATGKLLKHFHGHTKGVCSVAFSANGLRAVSGAQDGTVRIWDLPTAKEQHCLTGHAGIVRHVAISPDGQHVLSCGHEDFTVRWWDVRAEKELWRWTHPQRAGMHGVAIARKGPFALASGHETIRLWNTETGDEVRSLPGEGGMIFYVAFSPDGRRALSCGNDHSVRLLELATGKQLRRFDGHSETVVTVAFSPDGRRALSAGEDRTARLWDVETGRELFRFKGHTSRYVSAVVFTPDGNHALSSGADGMMRLWRLPKSSLKEKQK
jgi:WD40 repeat protein